jgi:hypothetical protein
MLQTWSDLCLGSQRANRILAAGSGDQFGRRFPNLARSPRSDGGTAVWATSWWKPFCCSGGHIRRQHQIVEHLLVKHLLKEVLQAGVLERVGVTHVHRPRRERAARYADLGVLKEFFARLLPLPLDG